MSLENLPVKRIVEAALMAAQEPLSVDRLFKLFRRGELHSEQGRQQIREALQELRQEAAGRGWELKQLASGYRFQVPAELAEWVSRLWEEKPPRYSRALLETLALIAYKQPATRGDIERVRGVAVSQNIMRTLLERGWIRVVGQREAPGRPNMYGTTRAFLDYFNLQALDELPPLAEIKAMIEPLATDEEAPGDAPEEAPEDVPEETLGEASEDVPEDVPEEALGEAPEEALGEAPEDAPAEAGEAFQQSGPEQADEAFLQADPGPAEQMAAPAECAPPQAEAAPASAGSAQPDAAAPDQCLAEVVPLPTASR